jgi:hypothetical protein
MPNPTAQLYPSSRAGKPINIGDSCTLVGTVTAVSTSGPTASLTITLSGSGLVITAQANDVAASGQTL